MAGHVCPSRLQVKFSTTDSKKNYTLTLLDPREDVTRAEVETVMQTIIDKQLINGLQLVNITSIVLDVLPVEIV